jgi:hypothetical protein
MKWQKNTGVMPCEAEKIVAVRHYCILDVPPFDYVEPKVWTVGESPCVDIGIVLKNGERHFSISPSMETQRIVDALNAWEERK